MEGGNPTDCRFACGKLILTNQRFGKITEMGNEIAAAAFRYKAAAAIPVPFSLLPTPYCLLPLLPYLSIASPNAAKAFTRSFRSGHLAMDFSVNRPSAGSSVARHSWAMRAQVAS